MGVYSADQLYQKLRELIPNLPKTCTKLVLTLRPCEMPIAQIETYLHDTLPSEVPPTLEKQERQFLLLPHPLQGIEAWIVSVGSTLLQDKEIVPEAFICYSREVRDRHTLDALRHLSKTPYEDLQGLRQEWEGDTPAPHLNILSYPRGWVCWDRRILKVGAA